MWRLAAATSLAAVAGGSTQSGQLTAGDVDDNLNFDSYLQFQSRVLSPAQQSQYTELHLKLEEQVLPNPTLSDRLLVNVTDESGAPFSCAEIEIPELQGPLPPAGTNGLLALFPSIDGFSGQTVQIRAKAPGGTCPESCSPFLTVDAETRSASLQIPAQASLPPQLDVAFVVDTTGSMCDELAYLQSEAVAIVASVQSQRTVDTRVANILYRDEGDDYVVQATQFGASTSDGPAIEALKRGTCGGGGDYPEAMDKALQSASQLQWRSGNTARVSFLIADAPPQDANLQATLNHALTLRRAGVKVYGLAASGVGDTAEYLMRMMALVTGARHLWLTDDSGIGHSHQEPKVRCYQVTRLDQLLKRVLRSELGGTRVEAEPSEIIREVGRQERGICLIDFQPSTTTSSQSETTAAGDGDTDDGGDESMTKGTAAVDVGEPERSSSSDAVSGARFRSFGLAHAALLALVGLCLR